MKRHSGATLYGVNVCVGLQRVGGLGVCECVCVSCVCMKVHVYVIMHVNSVNVCACMKSVCVFVLKILCA